MRRIIRTGALLVALEALLASGCGDDGDDDDGPHVSYNDGSPGIPDAMPDGDTVSYNDGGWYPDAGVEDGGDTSDSGVAADASDEPSS